MKTRNSDKKSTTSDRDSVVKEEPIDLLPLNVAFSAIDTGYRRARAFFYAALAVVAVGLAVAAAVHYNVLTIPGSSSVRMPKSDFPLLHQEWKDYLAMQEAPRRLCFRDRSYRNMLCTRAWKSPNPNNQFIGKEYAAWITEDIPPRVLCVPGVVNIRDFGGWKTEDGKKVRQGIIIRSGELNAKSYYHQPGRNFLNIHSRQILVKQLGIKTDIDLRWDNEVEGMKQSPIGPEVEWKHYPWSLYQWIGSRPERETFFYIFRELIDRNNLPALVHCVYGKDRTGTLCFILQGILGVSDDDKLRDWEASAFWFNDMNFVHQKGIDGLINWLKETYATRSVNEDCVAYAKSCGLTDDDINAFRNIMLEDVQ